MTDTLTLARWLVYWLETYVKPTAKPSGYAQYRDICTGHIIPAMGDTPLEAVTTAQLQAFFNHQKDHGNLKTGGPLSAKSIKNMRIVLDVAFQKAIQEKRLGHNPGNPKGAASQNPAADRRGAGNSGALSVPGR